MTGRTHDLAAFTALSFILVSHPLMKMSLATVFVAFSANMIGGIAPDIDQPTSSLWRQVPAGSIVGRLIDPLLGGHRYISHSIAGLLLFGYGLSLLLGYMKSFLLVDMNIVWWSFMIGFVSHLCMDFITHEGEPLLFPLSFKFGFPPFKMLRMKTGGFIEKLIVFPVLLLINVYIIYSHYHVYLDFLRHYIVK